MPRGIAEHYNRLVEAGAVFEPYTFGHGSTGSASRLDGESPNRDVLRERTRLQEYWHTLSETYRNDVERLVDSIAPMDERCRISVYVPARFEERFLVRTVRLLATQTDDRFRPLPQWMYEIVVINNVFENENFDESEVAVRDYCSDAGVRNVRFANIKYPVGTPCPLTLSCRLGADTIVRRSLARRAQSLPLYIAAEDADLVWTDPRQLWYQLTELDSNPDVDAVRGHQDRCPWEYLENDLVSLMRRSWNLTENYFSLPHFRPESNVDANFTLNRVVTSGWNTAFSAEVYGMIRGYSDDRWLGNDVDLGEKISLIRSQQDGRHHSFETRTLRQLNCRSEGSPRRWYLQAANGVSPYDRSDNYANFHSLETLEQVGDSDMTKLIANAAVNARISDANRHLFEDELTSRRSLILELRGPGDSGRRQVSELFRWLGIGPNQWQVDDDRVVLVDDTGFSKAMARLRARYVGPGPVRPRPVLNSALPIWRSYVA